MKFRILLWLLGRMLGKASKTSPQLQKELADKALGFTLQTFDQDVARSFQVRDQRISSHSGGLDEPVFTLGFRDAAYAFQVLTAKNKQLAFMQGIQDKNIRIEGDPAQVIWFQGLLKHIATKKKKQSPSNRG